MPLDSAIRIPPGPRISPLGAVLYRPGRDRLAFFTDLARTYGDVSHVRLGFEHLVLLTDPADVRDVLVVNQAQFLKGRALERARPLLGRGLLTSEREEHRRQRRLIQPLFHRERIASYSTAMAEAAAQARDRWVHGGTLDVSQEMMRLTLAIVGRTLFGSNLESDAADVRAAMAAVMDSFWTRMLPLADLLERLPMPQLRRARAARARLDGIIYRLIAERRAAPGDRGDLLSMLLAAQDEEAGGRIMTDAQVRDEAMTIFLAGHETTANALAWTWYLLSRAPDVERRLHAEVDRVLGGRLPGFDDVAMLPFTEQVVMESMRLYPPAWLIGRRAVTAYPVKDFVLPAGTIVVLSPYVTQRDERFFPEPERFDPDRWTPAFKAALPPFAYFPFGGGPRRCIGESFAWIELVLAIATIAQQWRLRLVPDQTVVPQPVMTLRTKEGIRMVAERR